MGESTPKPKMSSGKSAQNKQSRATSGTTTSTATTVPKPKPAKSTTVMAGLASFHVGYGNPHTKVQCAHAKIYRKKK